MSNLTQFYQSGQGQFNTCDVFYESGTWTAPPGITRAMVLVWGGGGSGSVFNGYASTTGGCGGGFAQGIVATTPGTGYTITIGAGGASVNVSSSNNGFNGNAGGTSSFSTLLTATGGAGGLQQGSGTVTANGGSGSSSGTLWSFTATGGGMKNNGYFWAGGGGSSGSPYGNGSGYQNDLYVSYGTGGCGWGPIGYLQPPGSSVMDYPAFPDTYGCGGGGIAGASQGYGSGGGGSHRKAQPSIQLQPTSAIAFTKIYVNATSYVGYIMANPGGGQKNVPSFMYATNASNVPVSSSSSTATEAQEDGNYFNIVNKSLSGSGGHGWFYNTNGTSNFDEAKQMFRAGDGGSGSGGGGIYIGSPTAPLGNVMATGGSGGIGGGGGGVAAYRMQGAHAGGYGGFGGGGGGSILTYADNSGYMTPQGGVGGVGGGGGGGSTNVPGGSGFGQARSGRGANGCVLIFYRAT